MCVHQTNFVAFVVVYALYLDIAVCARGAIQVLVHGALWTHNGSKAQSAARGRHAMPFQHGRRQCRNRPQALGKYREGGGLPLHCAFGSGVEGHPVLG